MLLRGPFRSAYALFAIAALIIGVAVLRDATGASARIFNVSIVDPNAIGFSNGDFDVSDAQTFPLTPSDGVPGNVGFQIDTFFAPIGTTVWIGVSTEEGAGDISADSAGYGAFPTALCNDNDANGQDFKSPDDMCRNMTGVNTSHLIIPDAGNSLEHQPPNVLPRIGVAIAFTCGATPGIARIVIGQSNSTFSFFIVCSGALTQGNIAASQTQLEIAPQRGSFAHSLILLTLADASGGIVAGYQIEWSVDRCSIEADAVDTVEEVLDVLTGGVNIEKSIGPDSDSPTVESVRNLVYDFNGDGRLEAVSLAVVHCETGHSASSAPGPIHVTARATRAGDPTIVFSILLNLVGPPANILISASPTQVRCGEKSTVTAIVVDSAGQTVSDNTSVEFVVNLGGTGTAGPHFRAGRPPVVRHRVYSQRHRDVPRLDQRGQCRHVRHRRPGGCPTGPPGTHRLHPYQLLCAGRRTDRGSGRGRARGHHRSGARISCPSAEHGRRWIAALRPASSVASGPANYFQNLPR